MISGRSNNQLMQKENPDETHIHFYNYCCSCFTSPLSPAIGATDYGRVNSSYAHVEQSISDMASHCLNTLRMCDYHENVYDTENITDYRDICLMKRRLVYGVNAVQKYMK